MASESGLLGSSRSRPGLPVVSARDTARGQKRKDGVSVPRANEQILDCVSFNMEFEDFQSVFGTRGRSTEFGEGCGWNLGWSRTPIAPLSRGSEIKGWVRLLLTSRTKSDGSHSRVIRPTVGFDIPFRGKVRHMEITTNGRRRRMENIDDIIEKDAVKSMGMDANGSTITRKYKPVKIRKVCSSVTYESNKDGVVVHEDIVKDETTKDNNSNVEGDYNVGNGLANNVIERDFVSTRAVSVSDAVIERDGARNGVSESVSVSDKENESLKASGSGSGGRGEARVLPKNDVPPSWAISMKATTEPTRFRLGDVWENDDRLVNALFDGRARRHMATRSQTELSLSRKTARSVWVASVSTIMAPSHMRYYGQTAGVHCPVAVVSTPTLTAMRTMASGKIVVGVETSAVLTTASPQTALDYNHSTTTIGVKVKATESVDLIVRANHTLTEWQAIVKTPFLSGYASSPTTSETFPLIGFYAKGAQGKVRGKRPQYHLQVSPSTKEVGGFVKYNKSSNSLETSDSRPSVDVVGALKARLDTYGTNLTISLILSGEIP
eukprot:CFRG3382T1